ncbi:hypothetical protein BGZ92_001896 [Podila epicladia]|nr:hypothetical protein BGZ92_001896 [Podila epicladia]
MPALRSAPGRAAIVNSASLTGVITVEDVGTSFAAPTAFEQWQQNLTCTTRGTYHHVKDSFGLASSFGNPASCVSDRHRPPTPFIQTYGGVNKNLGSIPDGFLGPKDALGREDIVYKPTHDIAIKPRASADPLLPMSSVPHDWSWSTF